MRLHVARTRRIRPQESDTARQSSQLIVQYGAERVVDITALFLTPKSQRQLSFQLRRHLHSMDFPHTVTAVQMLSSLRYAFAKTTADPRPRADSGVFRGVWFSHHDT